MPTVYLLLSILWSVIMLLITLTPGEAIPKAGIIQADKYVHFFIFTVWMILTSCSILKVRYFNAGTRYPVMITGLGGLCIGIMIECLQHYVPGRNFSLPDILANSTGVVSGYLVIWFFRKWKTV